MISSALLATFICFSSARSSPQQHGNNLQGVLQADKTCCRQQTAEGPCLGELAGDGSNCIWVADSDPAFAAAYDPCVGPGFYTCMTSGSGPCGSPVAPTCESGTGGGDGGDSGTGTGGGDGGDSGTGGGDGGDSGTGTGGGDGGDGAGNTQGSPGSVGDQIDEDGAGTKCTNNNVNCWTASVSKTGEVKSYPAKQDVDFSTNTITYEGATYDAENGCCLYSYNSVFTGNLNCEGSSPAQSHWLLDVQCGAYSITYGTIDGEMNPTNDETGEPLVVDGEDKSTCYSGVKFDHMCDTSCDYQVCLSGAGFGEGQCGHTEGWIIDKAASVYSFNSLDGVPVCAVDRKESMKFVEVMEGLQNGEMMSGQMMGVMLFAVAIIAGLLYRWYRGYNKDEKYKKLTGDAEQTESYQTFV